MSPSALAFAFAFLNTASAPATDLSVDGQTGGTAGTLSAKHADVGLWAPLRYGVTDHLELSTHPALNARMPNLRARQRWRRWRSWQVTTLHEFTYPTPLLRDFRREGTLGLFPLDTDIPHIFTLRNAVLMSSPGDDGRRFTILAGVRGAARSGASRFPTLDLPVLFPRTAPYQGRIVTEFGFAADGEIASWLRYRLLVDLFFVTPDDDGDVELTTEHAAAFTWPASDGLAVHLGYRLVFGQYPYGEQVDLLPIADVQWAFEL